MPKQKSAMLKKVKDDKKAPEEGWFRDQMRERGLLRKNIAERLNVQGNAVWQMLRGERRVQIPEIQIWAELLQQDFTEVARRFGYPIPARHCNVTGAVNDRG